jgi:mono/diheme cytochrome c family protein
MIDGLGLPRDFSAGKVRYGCNAILRDGWAAERGEASTETPLRSEVTIVTRNLPAETEPQRLPHKFLAENLWGNRMQNIVVLIVSIAAAMFLAWSSTRAWRIKNIVLKWTGAGLAALLATAVSLAGVVMIAGLFKLHARSAPTPDMKVAGTPEQIQRGRAIADSFCGACHSKNVQLAGGFDIADDLPIPIGSFVSSNLTPAGDLSHWSDGEIFRAIRNGVDADGHWLIIMSYTNAGKLSDDDIQAVIGYLRSAPAAGQKPVNPPDHLNPLGLVMLGAGMLPMGKPVSTSVVAAPSKGPTAQYGEYILSYQDCRECHGANLAGGVPGQLAPIGPGLSLVKQWSLADFISTMRTGTDPAGHELGKQMPWRPIGKMDDEELAAIYQYLIHLPND